MIFQKKYQRGMELLRKKNGSDPDQSDAENREIKRELRRMRRSSWKSTTRWQCCFLRS